MRCIGHTRSAAAAAAARVAAATRYIPTPAQPTAVNTRFPAVCSSTSSSIHTTSSISIHTTCSSSISSSTRFRRSLLIAAGAASVCCNTGVIPLLGWSRAAGTAAAAGGGGGGGGAVVGGGGRMATTAAAAAGTSGASASTGVLVVYVTAPSTDVAGSIAEQLVTAKLAACVNIVPGITSVYSWKGKIEKDAEVLMIIKTQAALLDTLTAKVKELHPYDEPEVIGLPVVGGSESYLKWVADSTT